MYHASTLLPLKDEDVMQTALAALNKVRRCLFALLCGVPGQAGRRKSLSLTVSARVVLRVAGESGEKERTAGSP